MTLSPDVLWWVNSEYCKRLNRAEKYVTLLEQLVLARASADQEPISTLLAVLHEARRNLALLLQDHRDWRHTYYYQSARRKRMVQSDEGIERALLQFGALRARHEPWLHALAEELACLPRPDPDLTYVPVGDLWLMTQYAISDLVHFVDQPDSLPPSNARPMN